MNAAGLLGRSFLRIFLGLAIWWGGVLVPLEGAFGVTTYVIGDEDHPWEASAVESDRIDFQAEAGVIQPVWVDSTKKLPVEGTVEVGNIFTNVFHNEREEFPLVIDGDPTTAILRDLSPAGLVSTYFLPFDLGAPLIVTRVRFYPREQFMEKYLTQFDILINDGTPASLNILGNAVLRRIYREMENLSPVVDIRLAPRLVRYLVLQPRVPDEEWEIAEVEIYGTGYAPEASYTSEIIDFEDVASWGRIRWSGAKEEGVRVLIQTRTGMDLDPNVYWWKTGRVTVRGEEESSTWSSGEPLTRKDYLRVKPNQRGRITYDTENWSFWSAPYDFDAGRVEAHPEGVSITSPGPHRFFQVKVTFLPTSTEAGALDFLAFEFSKPPAAKNVVGEIWPLDVRAAETTTFTYAIRSTIRAKDKGFDSVTIRTPERVDTVRSVRIDRVEVPFTQVVQGDRFSITLPQRVKVDGTLVEVTFDTRVFAYGTTFPGWVFDSQTDDVPQLINAGDATLDLEGDELSVRMSLGESLIVSATVSPNPITPNGDGINDAAEVVYTLLHLTDFAPVSVRIYNLSGTIVRTVYSGQDLSGEYVRDWDGRDDAGTLVPPGLYIYQISVESDEQEENASGTISVVY